MVESWSNWSGSVRCEPHRIERPSDERELCEAVRRAAREGLEVRAAGSGHSFTPLVATSGVVISLETLHGIESADRGALQANVRAGTRICDLAEPLLELGMGMENQGDIDTQSIAGALGTGTHGTGRTLRNLSSQALRLRLVDPEGGLVECSAEEDPELYLAARVSLGALGVLSAATLQLLSAYRLHERVWRAPVDEVLDGLDTLVDGNRHFEFFWFPRGDLAELKTLNPTDREPDDLPDREGERVGWSQHIISSVRELKFNEMEYSVPAASGPSCFRAVRERMQTKHPDVVWPVEYRTVRPDDAYLSPAHGRETVTISVHQDGRLPFEELFGDVEPIFRSCGGRPHWGKVHGCRASELRDLYPEWERFCSVRRRVDPHGLFLNPYLRQLLDLG